MSESVLAFGSVAHLVGILTPGSAVQAEARPAVLLLNSGLIHRVAPSGLYVRIARELAAMGHDCFRFDFSGIGDSSVRTDSLPVEQSGVAETREAMDLLGERFGHRQFILLGLCGGGYFSFRTACLDDRVVGLALLNVRGHLHGDDPEVDRQLVDRAMALHYRRIATARTYRRKNLLKILRGDFDLAGALRGLRNREGKEAGALAPTAPMGRDFEALLGRPVRILNVYSEGDWSLDYLTASLGDAFVDKLTQSGSRFELMRGANHVFTLGWTQDRVVEILLDWLDDQTWGRTSRHA